jgi:hypothetical protein
VSRRISRARKLAFYILNWAQIALGWFYLACRFWAPGAFAVGTALAVRVWFEWAMECREAGQCDSRVHRDFTDEDIRCQLPAGHAAHRNGEREWRP